MKTANLSDVDTVFNIFSPYTKELIAVPKRDIQQAIVEGRCLLEWDVALIYRRWYERTYYGVPMTIGAFQIMDVACASPGSGNAQKALDKFFDLVKQQVFLFVKADNLRAIKFYEKNGFVGKKQVKFPTFNSLLMVRPWPSQACSNGT